MDISVRRTSLRRRTDTDRQNEINACQDTCRLRRRGGSSRSRRSVRALREICKSGSESAADRVRKHACAGRSRSGRQARNTWDIHRRAERYGGRYMRGDRVRMSDGAHIQIEEKIRRAADFCLPPRHIYQSIFILTFIPSP